MLKYVDPHRFKDLQGVLLRERWIKTYEVSFFGMYIKNKKTAHLLAVRVQLPPDFYRKALPFMPYF